MWVSGLQLLHPDSFKSNDKCNVMNEVHTESLSSNILALKQNTDTLNYLSSFKIKQRHSHTQHYL